MPTPSAEAALKILRDPATFQWYVIPLLAIAFYVYAVETEKRNYNAILAGLAYWGMDWFNEIWNALFFHFSGTAPVWGAPGKTAFLILIGLNIEICFMFLLSGVVWVKMLPPDKTQKILGLPNRLAVAVGGSLFCVFVEMLLNAAGALTWDWSWWSIRAPWLIFLIGYLPFFLVSFWVYDMPSRKKQLAAVGAICGFDAVCLIVFGAVLGWI
jgi:hypothetical protein